MLLPAVASAQVPPGPASPTAPAPATPAPAVAPAPEAPVVGPDPSMAPSPTDEAMAPVSAPVDAPAPATGPMNEDFVRAVVDGMPKPFEFHGYLRSGFGLNGKGGELESFGIPGTFGYKYRLGNETDTYGEAVLRANWLNPSGDGATFATQILIGFKSSGNNNYDDSVEFRIREAFAEAGNVIPQMPGATFWAGQRFYQRHDVHLLDYFFLDMSGLGGGFQNFKAGPGKLSVAFLGGAASDADPTFSFGRRTKKNLDIRYNDIQLPDGSLLSAWADLVFHSPSASDEDTIFGFSGALIHFKGGLLGGFNKLVVQYGQGPGAGFNTYLGNDNTDASNLRITEQLQIQPFPRLSLMAVGALQRYDNGGDYTANWVSVGVRPIYHFTQYLSVATELGLDYATQDNPTDTADGVTGQMAKLTIAPQLTPGANFWARPSIRAFATIAFWNDDVQGQVGGSAYGAATHGTSFGLQAESWW
ncbi:MAG: carbohydrate porin [Kofleriaceae bacterium]